MGKSKRCCEWHNELPETFEKDSFGYIECGLAGMGRPSVCCRNCPHHKWFTEDRTQMGMKATIKPEHIDVISEIMALPEEVKREKGYI